MIKEQKEEMLELAWVNIEKGVFSREVVEQSKDKQISVELLDELIKEGYLKEEGQQLNLTSRGEKEARRLIRSHRLSERLFTDVLNIAGKNMEEHACAFEHFLSDEVVDSICTLLGHPKECPHGRAIPPGPCCEKALKEIAPLIIPLNEIKAGAEVQIAYVATKSDRRLDQLAIFGIIPGTTVHVHQIKPSFVLKIGETNIALDDDVIKDVYVKQLC